MPKAPFNGKTRTSVGLREILFEEIESLRTGKGDIQRAKAIGSLAAQIISSARLDFDYSRYHTDGVALPVKSLPLGEE